MKSVLVLTDVNFWAGGAGHRARISRITHYLSEFTQLTVYYLGRVDPKIKLLINKNSKFEFISLDYQIENSVRRVGEIIEKLCYQRMFDSVIIEYVHNSTYLEFIPEGVKLLLDAHDIISDRTKSFKSFNYAGIIFEITEQLEYELFDLYDHVVLLSRNDFEKVDNALGQNKSLLCPHPASPRFHELRQEASKIGFVASEYPPNYDAIIYFMQECWPHIIQGETPVLYIFGNITRLLAGEKIPGQVELKGFIQNLDEIYDQMDIMINPVRFGAGFKIKNIEALSNGLPLVTTSHGASGIEGGINDSFLIADNAGMFVDHIKKLIKNEVFRKNIGKSAYEFAKKEFSEDACFSPLLRVINN